MKRWPRVLTVVVAAALLPVVALAPPAAAGLSTPVPMNQFEEVTDSFTDDDALFVYVLSDTRGGAVCVVDASHDSAEGLSCKGSKVAWSTPNTIVGIGSVIQPIESPSLVAGSYKLLSENSAHEGTGLSDVFTVSVCNTCDPSIASGIVAKWKAQADDLKDAYGLTCAGFAAKDIFDQATAARGKVKKATDRADSYESGASGFFATVGPYVGGALGLGFGFPSLQGAIAAGQTKALEILRDLSCSTAAMYFDIVQDPPDPRFATVGQPSYRALPDMGSPGGDALAAALDQQTGNGEASLTAFERYLGAKQAGDVAGQVRQLEAVGAFTFDTADDLVETAGALREHAAELASLPSYDQPVVTEESLQRILEVRRRVTSTGFTADELAQLGAGGLSAADIAAVRTHFDPAALAGLEPGVLLQDLLVQQASVVEAEVEGLRQFGKDAVASARRTAARYAPPNAAPTAAFTRSPASGQGPLTVTVHAGTSRDSDGSIVSYDWDFGDGGSGTGITAQHVYPDPGTYTVTLTVADDDGATASSSASVLVTSGPQPNAPPVARLSQGGDGDIPLPVPFDGSTSSDSDGEIVSYAWDFGDGSTGTGARSGHTYTTEGTFVVTLTVTDDDGATGSTTSTVHTTKPNQAPVAVFSIAPPTGSAPLSVRFTDESTDPEGGVITYRQWSFWDGTSSFEPTVDKVLGLPGTYSSSLFVCDSRAGCSSTTRFTVVDSAVPGNLPPVAGDDTVEAPQARSVRIEVLADDRDPDGDPLQVGDFTQGQHGSVSCESGACTYTGVRGFAGQDSFTYTAVDGRGGRATARVAVTVVPNRPPVASDDEVEVGRGQSAAVFVLSNDADPEGYQLSVLSWTDPAHGSVVCASTHCTYTAGPGYAGPDAFSYTAMDDLGGTDAGLVSVSVVGNRPPQPGLDTVPPFARVAAVDVLANDVDPDADQVLTLVGTTAPGHGTVTCGALGGCLYSAEPGYSGPDSFTYTVRDSGGLTAAARVELAPTGEQVATVSAVADDLTVEQDTTGALDVLANDSGDALEAEVRGPPAHGGVSCLPSGTCSYVPDRGFSGVDGFTYRVSGPGGSATGAVRVAVVPQGAGFVPTATGRGASLLDPAGAVGSGGQASWAVGVQARPGGLSQELAAALEPPRVSAKPSVGQVLDAGSVRTAPGFTATVAPDGSVEAQAGPGALLGASSESDLPAPMPPISQGTGGDGHVPILVGSKVFAFFHHQHPTAVSCVDRVTGQLCPGYPRPVTLGAGSAPGKAVVIGNRIWTTLEAVDEAAQSSSYGVACFDAAAGELCGWTIVERQVGDGRPRGTVPVLAGGRLWIGAGSGDLHCVDPADGRTCGSVPSGLLKETGHLLDAVGLGAKVFMVSGAGALVCTDTGTRAPCAGWPAPVAVSGHDVMVRHSRTGAADGVCVIGGELVCWAAGGGSGRVHPGWTLSTNVYSYNSEAESGVRTFRGDFTAGLSCYDWSTEAVCEGEGFEGGHVRQDATGQALPTAYGAAFDGSCIVALGDPGQVFTVAPNGTSPCTTLTSGARKVTDLRDQRCGDGVGGARWRGVEVLDADLPAEFSSFEVLVRDATSDAVLLRRQLVGAGTSLDLSSLDPDAHPALVVEAAAVSRDGGPAWADGRPPRVRLAWQPDPAQLCLRTTVPAAVCDEVPEPVTLTATLGREQRVASLRLSGIPGGCDTDPVLPQAFPDDLTVVEDTSGLADVLANDLAAGVLALQGVTVGPAHGTAVVEQGRVRYTPVADYVGPDSFTYAASLAGMTVTALVRVQVTAVDDPAALVPPAAATVQYSDGLTAPVLQVLDVDSPLTGLTLTASGLPPGLVLGPLNGTGRAPVTGVASGPAGRYPVALTLSGPGVEQVALVEVTVAPEDATAVLTAPATAPAGTVSLAALVTQAADGASGDLALARIELQVRAADSQTAAPYTSGLLVPDADGLVRWAPTLPEGVYTVSAQFEADGRHFTGPPASPVRLQVTAAEEAAALPVTVTGLPVTTLPAGTAVPPPAGAPALQGDAGGGAVTGTGTALPTTGTALRTLWGADALLLLAGMLLLGLGRRRSHE